MDTKQPLPILDPTTDIRQIALNDNQYYAKETEKRQIVIHHTSSGPNPVNVIAGWNANEVRVATPFIIAGKPTTPTSQYFDGEIVQCFKSKYWGYALGMKPQFLIKGGPGNDYLNQMGINIEVCNWGGLTLKNGKYYTYVGTEVPADEVCDLGKVFRTYRYYHKYTPAQIESLRKLIVYLATSYKIPKFYNEDMWDISTKAKSGTLGIYTHVSYNPEKSDMSPQPDLIAMLKSLV